MIDDYVDFIEKEKTTPWFGLNIDFGVFQNRRSRGGPTQAPAGQARGNAQGGGAGARGGMGGEAMEPSKVEDMIPLLPYVHCCHAKFMEMDDNCEETSIPYPEIVKMLVEHKWNGYLLSEYEGEDRKPRRSLPGDPKAPRDVEASARRSVAAPVNGSCS